MPVGAILTPGSLAAIRIPVGIVEAQADRMLNPAYHSALVLKLCGACERLDLLSPWPDAIAKVTAGVRGGERNAAVDESRRSEAYSRVAEFFRRHLLD